MVGAKALCDALHHLAVAQDELLLPRLARAGLHHIDGNGQIRAR